MKWSQNHPEKSSVPYIPPPKNYLLPYGAGINPRACGFSVLSLEKSSFFKQQGIFLDHNQRILEMAFLVFTCDIIIQMEPQASSPK